ncbi:ABC transporter ATP-binding protein [uncultured Cohaesibacter sp.]|uniref:ABC transporter ATP-binding protein n=1 Tax=uncultured Cohaesibacter sp. TaxID=1002546 RepID=UPI0029C94280|nr:ABC transporter ATP-binding protein [uncultured Cohaesibacter sp.]
MTGDILTVQDLKAGYQPDLPIIRGVDLTIKKGEFVVLLGPNGAGKSTLVKAIAGLVPIHSGQVFLKGKEITRSPAYKKLHSGMTFVPQTENIFTQMSIRENLQISAQILPKKLRLERIEAMFAMFPDLAKRPATRAGSLSGGQRQMLAVARALITDPQVLILDEPSAGLSPLLVDEVFERIKMINQGGVTILLVEQNVRVGLAVSSRGVILVEGKVAHDAASVDLAGDPVVAELYLGGVSEETVQ